MSKFSIAPPPRGTEEELNIPFVPNIENIIRFANGDIGIADNIRFSSIQKIINNSPYMTPQMLSILANTGQFKLKNSPESYITNNKANVNIDDIELLGDQTGLKSLEKSLLQSVFETQGPWVKLSLEIIKKLPTLENIIAKVLSLKSKSLKPIKNPKSLTYKILGNDDISKLESMVDNIPDIKNRDDERNNGLNIKDNNIITEDPNNNIENYTWRIIDEQWSTGIFLPFIDYNIEYIDIIQSDISDNLESSSFDIPPQEDPDLPETIIFGYFNQNGNEISLPSRYRGDKYWGSWTRIQEISEHTLYGERLNQLIDVNLNKRDLNNSEKIKARNFIRKNLNSREIVEEGIESCFLETIRNTDPEEGFNIGSDSNVDINRMPVGMFLPKKINFNGEEVVVDPENYLLQIIRIEDNESDNTVDFSRNLSNERVKNLPLSGNYQGKNCRDIFESGSSYISESGNSRRVVRVKNTDNNDINSGRRYIIEGVLRTQKSENTDTSSSVSNESNESNWYRKPSFFGAITDFINMLIDIALELIPEINSLINLFSDPKNIIFDRIFKTLGENYKPFSQEVLNDWQTLLGIDKNQRREFIRGSALKDYVALDQNNELEFVFDGIATIPLFGQAFNIELEDLIPNISLGNIENESPQILIQFMMGLITFPIELVLGILKEILAFFENIADITKLPDTAQFFTFNWILDFFKPQKILSLIGIELNIERLAEFKQNINVFEKFDLSEIIAAPIIFKLPTFTQKGFKAWVGSDLGNNIPIQVLQQLLKLLEGIICGILNFIWDLLNLQALFGNPCFSLTDGIKDLIKSDLANNGESVESIDSDDDNDNDYFYNINITDGRNIRRINSDEVIEFISSNPNVKFTFVN